MHFILSTSNGFFLDELLAILKLREKYDGIKLAMVIVYAKASKNDQVDSRFSADAGTDQFHRIRQSS